MKAPHRTVQLIGMFLTGLALLVFAAFGGTELLLEWRYPAPITNTVFEVWHSPTFIDPLWVHMTNVSGTNWRFRAGSTQDFFIVRASNTVTHGVSDWGHR